MRSYITDDHIFLPDITGYKYTKKYQKTLDRLSRWIHEDMKREAERISKQSKVDLRVPDRINCDLHIRAETK